jgi:hypothetical protein
MPAHIDGEIRDGRHHMQIRVYYEDTDFSCRFGIRKLGRFAWSLDV